MAEPSEVRLLDEENPWGKPTEEQEKIMAMTAEINSLKKECQGTACRILGLTAFNSLLQFVNWLVWEVCSVN